jgi:hypothetical protein
MAFILTLRSVEIEAIQIDWKGKCGAMFLTVMETFRDKSNSPLCRL